MKSRIDRKSTSTPAQGERLVKALDTAMDEAFEVRKDVSAETSRRRACDCGVVHWREDEKGDSLNIGRLRYDASGRDAGVGLHGLQDSRITVPKNVKNCLVRKAIPKIFVD